MLRLKQPTSLALFGISILTLAECILYLTMAIQDTTTTLSLQLCIFLLICSLSCLAFSIISLTRFSRNYRKLYYGWGGGCVGLRLACMGMIMYCNLHPSEQFYVTEDTNTTLIRTSFIFLVCNLIVMHFKFKQVLVFSQV